ncbi:hypothetical protein [Streptomyces sp. NPDC004270]
MRQFPADLARAQQEWSATYRQLAQQPGRTELRRRLYRLSAQLYFHAYWQQRRPSPDAWRDLRDLGWPDRNANERHQL